MAYTQGFFKARNPGKIKGNSANIQFRSSWELKFMMKLDADPSILEWSSEEIYIGYINPKTGRASRYFPDFYYRTATDEYIVEIKPRNQMLPPTISKKKHPRKYMKEALTFAQNQTKWQAAEKYCYKRGMKFVVLNEYDLGIKT
jgi:hypothetical protein